MGTSVSGYLTPEEIAKVKDSSAAMTQVGADSGTTAGKFVFFAAFDGTNNDKNNVSLSGNPYQTNVANVFAQADFAQATNPNLNAKYYSGVGTGDGNGN